MTQELALKLFEYREGSLYCKIDIGYKHKVGDKAAHLNGDGYMHVWYKDKMYKEHRIIFLMVHGFLPRFIDHKDLNKANNQIDNLREATSTQNQFNKNLQSSNTSGFKGVTKRFGKNSWIARLTIGNERKYLGDFKTPEEAYEVYKRESLLHHKEFARV